MGTRSYLTGYGVARNVPRTGEERAGAPSRASMRLGQGRARASPCFFWFSAKHRCWESSPCRVGARRYGSLFRLYTV